MIRTLLIFDDKDPDMGAYFAGCAHNVKVQSNGLMAELIEIRSENLTAAYLNSTIENLNGSKFLCIVYSHGSKKSFLANEAFIVEGDTERFSNSIFYTFSCHTGNDVGADIIRKGCSLFWGYTSKASFVVGYLSIFVDCANFGIIKLFQGETSGNAYVAMKEYYSNQIDALYKSDYFAASILMENRDGMILRGRWDIRLSDFLAA